MTRHLALGAAAVLVTLSFGCRTTTTPEQLGEKVIQIVKSKDFESLYWMMPERLRGAYLKQRHDGGLLQDSILSNLAETDPKGLSGVNSEETLRNAPIERYAALYQRYYWIFSCKDLEERLAERFYLTDRRIYPRSGTVPLTTIDGEGSAFLTYDSMGRYWDQLRVELVQEAGIWYFTGVGLAFPEEPGRRPESGPAGIRQGPAAKSASPAKPPPAKQPPAKPPEASTTEEKAPPAPAEPEEP